jgi:Protein tyrosine and serine/threonine kinase
LPLSPDGVTLRAEQVIHDRRLAQVGRVKDEASGATYMRKVGKHVLGPEGLAVLDFLAALVADPQPNLLVPISFSGAPGEVLVEDYDDLTALKKLDVESFEVRRELSQGRTSMAQVVDLLVQLSDAVDFIHRSGFVHRDVRSTNVFLRRDPERLVPILFDYDSITRPFFSEEGELRVDLEAPPEVRVGHVMIDSRFDVYQLGWLLRKLTHYEAAPDIWTPVAPVSASLKELIGCATGPFGDRYSSAGELAAALLSEASAA